MRTRVAEVSQLGRNTQGVMLIRLAAEENLVGAVPLTPEDEPDQATADTAASPAPGPAAES